MAQSRIPMNTHINVDTTHRTVTVIVEHADWQSFSRAILPRANKEFKRWIREHIVFGELVRTNVSLAWHDVLGAKGRCITTATYTY